jgi:hypothetical protein
VGRELPSQSVCFCSSKQLYPNSSGYTNPRSSHLRNAPAGRTPRQTAVPAVPSTVHRKGHGGLFPSSLRPGQRSERGRLHRSPVGPTQPGLGAQEAARRLLRWGGEAGGQRGPPEQPDSWCLWSKDMREKVRAQAWHWYFFTSEWVCRCARRLERSAKARLQWEQEKGFSPGERCQLVSGDRHFLGCPSSPERTP